MKKIVILSGAGISAESGIRTFRDANGLWEGYDVMDVASPQGWDKDPALVLEFYNQRRKQALDAKPNEGHLALADLEKDFEVVVVTQNVDNLHEQAGSSQVIHLHGELFKCRSTGDERLVYDMDGWELNLGDKCEKGYQLRPHIVWFGEMVPMMDLAIREAMQADAFMVVGTSLLVYPAASLMQYAPVGIPKYVIDPKKPEVSGDEQLFFYEENATTGVRKAAEKIRQELL